MENDDRYDLDAATERLLADTNAEGGDSRQSGAWCRAGGTT